VVEGVTVNEVEYVLPLPSDIETGYVLGEALLGTMKLAPKFPVVSVVMALDGVIVVLPNFMVIGELAAKPLPWPSGISIFVPLWPDVG